MKYSIPGILIIGYLEKLSFRTISSTCENFILGIATICLWLKSSNVSILNENTNFSRHPKSYGKTSHAPRFRTKMPFFKAPISEDARL
jgi:hypothetical protein